jgi:hypothetical protein
MWVHTADNDDRSDDLVTGYLTPRAQPPNPLDRHRELVEVSQTVAGGITHRRHLEVRKEDQNLEPTGRRERDGGWAQPTAGRDLLLARAPGVGVRKEDRTTAHGGRAIAHRRSQVRRTSNSAVAPSVVGIVRRLPLAGCVAGTSLVPLVTST